MGLNPNHPVTEEMRTEWHKALALLMFAQGLTSFEVTEELIKRFTDSNAGAVIADTRNERFVVRLVAMEEAIALAKNAGGLPC